MAGEGTARERATRVLAYVSGLGGHGAALASDLAVVDVDDPAEIMAAFRAREFKGNCAHYSWIFQTLSRAAGIEARMVGIEGKAWFDGRGHAMNEVYQPETGRWMLVDPLYHAIFEDSEGRALSVLELRARLLSDGADGVHVELGEIRADPAPPEEILHYYGKNIIRVIYVGDNDLLGGRGEIYASPLAGALRLEAWPRPLRRIAENAVWGLDRRYGYVDRPELHDPFVSWYVLRAASALALVGLVWTGWILLRERRPRAPDAR